MFIQRNFRFAIISLFGVHIRIYRRLIRRICAKNHIARLTIAAVFPSRLRLGIHQDIVYRAFRHAIITTAFTFVRIEEQARQHRRNRSRRIFRISVIVICNDLIIASAFDSKRHIRALVHHRRFCQRFAVLVLHCFCSVVAIAINSGRLNTAKQTYRDGTSRACFLRPIQYVYGYLRFFRCRQRKAYAIIVISIPIMIVVHTYGFERFRTRGIQVGLVHPICRRYLLPSRLTVYNKFGNGCRAIRRGQVGIIVIRIIRVLIQRNFRLTIVILFGVHIRICRRLIAIIHAEN